MRSRTWPWSVAITVGTATILDLYLNIISQQGNRPVMWFVATLAIAGALPMLGLIVPSIRRACLAVTAGVLTVLAVLTGFSIGIFIFPIVVLTWVASAVDSRHSTRQRAAPLAPAGWYPDPGDPYRQRYWDGTMWTGYFA